MKVKIVWPKEDPDANSRICDDAERMFFNDRVVLCGPGRGEDEVESEGGEE